MPFRWHVADVVIILAAGLGHRIVAASVSLSVATVQRLVIVLAVAPLLLIATPTQVFVQLTRPRLIDAVTRWLAHPGVAIVVVTVFGTLTLISPVVDWGAHSTFGRDVTLGVVMIVGLILWLPALGLLPGATRLSPVARAGYVFVSSIVVTSLSIVWIFARHPLYPALHHQRAILHMSALFDQQLAGFVAKLCCYAPMWAVAFIIFSRADEDGTPSEETPLHWADVERQLLRVDRQRERAARRHQRE